MFIVTSVMTLATFRMGACSVALKSSSLQPTMCCSQPGSSVYGISQARILKWVAISFSQGSNTHLLTQGSNQKMTQASSALAGGFFTTESPGKP